MQSSLARHGNAMSSLPSFSHSESDGNPSTEDESSKGQEDLSPHPLPSSSDGVTSLSLPGHMEPVYMQQLGNTKIALSSSGVLLNGNLVPASTSPVFLNGSSFLQGPNGVILNGLSVGASQTVTLNSPKTTSSVVSNGVSITDILSSSSEDVKDFKLVQASVPNAAAATFSPSSIPVSFPGLIPSSEVKRESVQTAASQDGGSVVTFTAPVQINQYGIVQIPNSGTNGQLLNGSIGFSSLQLPPVSVAASQGKSFVSYSKGYKKKLVLGTLSILEAVVVILRGTRIVSQPQPHTVHQIIPFAFLYMGYARRGQTVT